MVQGSVAQGRRRRRARGRAVPHLAAQRPADPGQHLVQVERLHDVVVRPRVQSRDDVVRAVKRRDHEDRTRVAAVPQTPGHLEAVDPRQHEVQQDEVVIPRLDGGQGGLARLDALDLVAGAPQIEGQTFREVLLVLHDQDAVHAAPTARSDRGQADPHREAAALALALGADLPAVTGHDRADDEEADPHPRASASGDPGCRSGGSAGTRPPRRRGGCRCPRPRHAARPTPVRATEMEGEAGRLLLAGTGSRCRRGCRGPAGTGRGRGPPRRPSGPSRLTATSSARSARASATYSARYAWRSRRRVTTGSSTPRLSTSAARRTLATMRSSRSTLARIFSRKRVRSATSTSRPLQGLREELDRRQGRVELVRDGGEELGLALAPPRPRDQLRRQDRGEHDDGEEQRAADGDEDPVERAAVVREVAKHPVVVHQGHVPQHRERDDEHQDHAGQDDGPADGEGLGTSAPHVRRRAGRRASYRGSRRGRARARREGRPGAIRLRRHGAAAARGATRAETRPGRRPAPPGP